MSDDDDELAALRRERSRRLGASKVRTMTVYLSFLSEDTLSASGHHLGYSCDNNDCIYGV